LYKQETQQHNFKLRLCFTRISNAYTSTWNSPTNREKCWIFWIELRRKIL